MLVKRGLIPEKYDTNKPVKARKDIDPKYIFLRQIHSNPSQVEIHDLETDKATLTLDQNPEVIGMYNGKLWKKWYTIKVLTES